MKKIFMLCIATFCMLCMFSQINAQTKNTLISAVEQNDIKEVKKLLAEGADVNVIDKTSLTPLHHAIHKGNLKIAEKLIEKGADVNAHTEESETPLYMAVLHNDTKMVKYLISKGADVNMSLTSWTPLFHASLKGYKKIVKLLLKNGADVNVNYPIWAALSCHDEECSLKDKEDMLKDIIRYGGDIDKPMEEPNKMTALDQAIMDNKLETAKLLFKLGAKIKKGYLSKFYLQVATINNNKEMIELLLDNGVDINIKDNYGNTPLNYATTEEIKELLIQRGAKYGEDLK